MNDTISRSALLTKIQQNFGNKPEAQPILKHLLDMVEDMPTVKPSCKYRTPCGICIVKTQADNSPDIHNCYIN